MLLIGVTVSLSFSSSSFYQIFSSASYLLSDLYSPDDLHALPAINTTDKQQVDDNEETGYEANSYSDDFCGENEGDTSRALKVRSIEVFVLFLMRCSS